MGESDDPLLGQVRQGSFKLDTSEVPEIVLKLAFRKSGLVEGELEDSVTDCGNRSLIGRFLRADPFLALGYGLNNPYYPEHRKPYIACGRLAMTLLSEENLIAEV